MISLFYMSMVSSLLCVCKYFFFSRPSELILRPNGLVLLPRYCEGHFGPFTLPTQKSRRQKDHERSRGGRDARGCGVQRPPTLMRILATARSLLYCFHFHLIRWTDRPPLLLSACCVLCPFNAKEIAFTYTTLF